MGRHTLGPAKLDRYKRKTGMTETAISEFHCTGISETDISEFHCTSRLQASSLCHLIRFAFPTKQLLREKAFADV